GGWRVDWGWVVGCRGVARPNGWAGTQEGLMPQEGFQGDRVGEGSPKGLERGNRIVTAGRVPGPADRDGGHRLTMHFLGQVSRRWSLAQDQQAAELVRRGSGDLPIA